MQPQNRFTVYNASAGSGKTFQIASQYLSKILRAQDSSYIYRLLGITFTNKAAEEMKKRIIDSLIDASQGKITGVMETVSKALRSDIQRQTGITGDDEYRREIIERSKKRLFEILHYYDEFQLTTIDKLMYKIIRTFARDMQLPADVGVELDYKEVVNNLIDKLINQAEAGSLLSKILIDMSKRKIDDEKAWDIKMDLAQISSIIFDDNYFDEIKSLEDKTLEDFQKLKKLLYTKRENLHKTLQNRHLTNLQQVFDRYESHIISYYTGKIKAFISKPKDFYKIKEITDKKKENIYGEAMFFGKKFYKEFSEPENDVWLQNFFVDFIPFQFLHSFYTSLINNINSLSILNELNKEIEQFKTENNLVFIHDFNKLILERLLADLSGDTPYIYMRMGEKYGHFFVDEFQDTSALQWQNLIPLLKEALSKEFGNNEAGTSMIVGDAKQSIYRFRGGKPEQFIALSTPDDNSPQGNPFAQITGKNVENLEFNWRSQANIIRFNNEFFSTFPGYLNEIYQGVYQRDKVSQKIPEGKSPDEGFVQVRFYAPGTTKEREKEDFTELVLEHVLQAQKNGYRLDEICVLVDRNVHGRQISEKLIAHGIDVVSSESLLVGVASKVKLLLSILRFLDSGKTADLYEAVRYVARVNQLDEPDLYASFFKDREWSKQQYIEKFRDVNYALDYDQMMQFNLYDLAVYLTDIFKLTDDHLEYIYLQAFLEKIYEYQSRNESNLRAFLSEWNEIEHKFSVNAPKKQNSVQIMSVHKSKGLEFPVVIYYTKGNLISSDDTKNNTWIPVSPGEFAGFEFLPISIKALEKSPEPVYQEIFERVTSEKKFDNINRLYVALTRASEQLYVLLPHISKNGKTITYGNLLHNFLQTTGYQVEDNLYQYGNPARSGQARIFVSDGERIEKLNYKLWHLKDSNTLKINTLTFERWQESKKNAIAYGLQLHDILAQIETLAQWQEQKDKLLAGLSTTEKHEVEMLINKLLSHPDLQTYYSGEYRVLNEQSILIPAGKGDFRQKRPDRLLIKDKQVVIIDYKTGEPHNYHHRQLDEYASLLKEAGYETTAKILVYFQKDDVFVKILED